MNEQPDETSEVVRAGMRTAMAAATMAAQIAIRARQQRTQEMQAASEQRAAELQARFDAERSAAAATLAPVGRDDWWAIAQPQQIADVYEVAHAWEGFDPQARVAADKIRAEVNGRYGVDPASLGRSDELRREATEERQQARLDEAAAVTIAADVAADRADHVNADTDYQAAAETRADALWDSAERRTDMAASLEGVAGAEAVSARMLADTGQGKPARGAVAQRVKKSAAGTTKKQARTLAANQQPARGRGA